MGDFSKVFVAVSGYAESVNRIFILAHLHDALREKIPSAQLMLLENGEKWIDAGRYRWDGVGVSGEDIAGDRILVLGRDGQIATWENMLTGEINAIDKNIILGPMKGISKIGNEIFAYGMQRQLYRKTKNNKWTPWIKGMSKHYTHNEIKDNIHDIINKVGGITSVAGSDITKMYAVGINGEIWKNNGIKWNRLDSPTNLNLYGSALTESGKLYICGQGGTLLYGQGDEWKILEHDEIEGKDLYSIAWFKKKLYMADGHSLMMLEDGTVSKVDMVSKKSDTIPSHMLFTNGNLLLSVAGKEIFITEDGENWTSLI